MIWDEWVGNLNGVPVMLIKRKLMVFHFRADLHKFVRPDAIDCFHTHPAYAVRIVLRGGYIEELLDGTFRCWRPGDVGIVKPSFAHRVHLLLNNRESYSLWLRAPVSADIKLLGQGWPS